MNIWHKLIASMRDLGWLRKKPDDGPSDWTWVNDQFFTEHQRKTEKLASLARWIEGARVLVEVRKKQKKRYSDVLAAITKAQTHRLEIETGKRVYDPVFGDWILK